MRHDRARDRESILAFTVTVEATNDPPMITALADQTLAEDAGEQTVALSGIGSGAAKAKLDQLVSFTQAFAKAGAPREQLGTAELLSLDFVPEDGRTVILPDPAAVPSTRAAGPERSGPAGSAASCGSGR